MLWCFALPLGMKTAQASAFAVRSNSSVWMPQVPLRRLITRVPGLRPTRTSVVSIPAAISRSRAASMSATRQRLVAAGLEATEVRVGRKPGTRVMSLRSGTCGVHTLLLERMAKA